MASGLGAFAAGLVGGYTTGTRINMEHEDMERRKKTADLQDKMLDVQTKAAQHTLDEKEQENKAFSDLANYTRNFMQNGGKIAQPGLAPQPGATPTGATPAPDASAAHGMNATGAPGANAAPGLMPVSTAEPAPTGAPGAGIQRDGPGTPAEDIGFSLYQRPSMLQDPAYLNGAAQVLMASGSKSAQEKGINYLNAAYNAQKEGLLTAAKLANAGDLAGAAQAFNARGTQKVDPASLHYTDEKRTTIAGKMADGADFSFQPVQVLNMFRSPDHLAEEGLKYKELAVKERTAAAQEKNAEAASKRADAYDKLTASMEVYRQAQANHLNGMGAATPKQTNDLIAKGGLAMRKQLESEQPKEDAKYNVNGMVRLLPDMQAEFGQAVRNGTDPEIAYQQTLNTFHDRVAGLNDALGKIAADANSKWTSAGKDEAMTAGLQKLVSEGFATPDDIRKYLPATKIGTADAERVKSALGRVSGGKVSPPPTQATGTGNKDYSSLWSK